MTTKYTNLGLSEPVRFLNTTVLSFNSNLGFGTQESTLTVELIEDCTNGDGDVFAYGSGGSLVGSAQFFEAGEFTFGGIVTNWTTNEGSSGKTYTVNMSDPRRLLENAMVIVDTYAGTLPPGSYNVFPVYTYYEGSVLNGDCNSYGNSKVSDRGMPYSKVIQALQNTGGTIYSPTGAPFILDLSSIPSNVLPEYYRVNGPAISILQLITDICEAIGYDFYVYMTSNNVGNYIHFGFVDLRSQPNSFEWLINAFAGSATERSYGQELRIEKQKTMLIGEKQHYMVSATTFKPFFGETSSCSPITGAYDNNTECGFVVPINTTQLAASMRLPMYAGILELTEIDIRCAMRSFEIWKNRVSSSGIPGSFNAAVRTWLNNVGVDWDPKSGFAGFAAALDNTAAVARGWADFIHNPNASEAKLNQSYIIDDFKKIHQFVETLGRTYYGKQYLAKLNQKICYRPSGDIEMTDSCIAAEMMYTSVPTNDGGWVEPGGSVLGVSDPYLGFFRQEDGRLGGFAVFTALPWTANSVDEPVIVDLNNSDDFSGGVSDV